MKTVAFITSSLNSAHVIRGVGFYTKRLLAHLKQQAAKYDLEITEDVSHADLIHYPFFDLFSASLPISKQAKTVVTIHDVIPLEFP